MTGSEWSWVVLISSEGSWAVMMNPEGVPSDLEGVLNCLKQSWTVVSSLDESWGGMNGSEGVLNYPEQSWTVLMNLEGFSVVLNGSWTILSSPEQCWEVFCSHDEFYGDSEWSWRGLELSWAVLNSPEQSWVFPSCLESLKFSYSRCSSFLGKTGTFWVTVKLPSAIIVVWWLWKWLEQ